MGEDEYGDSQTNTTTVGRHPVWTTKDIIYSAGH